VSPRGKAGFSGFAVKFFPSRAAQTASKDGRREQMP
jgi:hypothetical protein